MESNITSHVDVHIGGPQDLARCHVVYNTIVLKPNVVGAKNILNPVEMRFPDTKYVIRWKFDLDGAGLNGTEPIRMPKNCLIELVGGSLTNGVIVGNDTVLINEGDNEDILENLTLDGTWKFHDRKLIILTEEAYESLSAKDPNALYFVTEE